MDLCFKKADFRQKLNIIAEISLLVYIAECVLGNSGRWLSVGPLSIRMILFVISFVATLPPLFFNLKQMVKNRQVIVAVCFGIWLCVAAVIGLKLGNSPSFVWADITGFLGIALVPGFIATMSNDGAIKRSINVIFWASVVLGGITLILHILFAFCKTIVIVKINDYFNDYSLGGVAALHSGISRIYLRSQIFLQVALIYGVWKIGLCKGKKRVVLLLCESVILMGLILSYTRGFWLGFAFSAVAVLVLEFKRAKQLLSIVGIVAVMLSGLMAISIACYRGPYVLVEVVNRFNPNLLVSYNSFFDGFLDDSFLDDELSYVDQSNADAVEIRALTLKALNEKIKENPVIGGGLGASLDGVRDGVRTEYMYLDVIMKTGVIGLILFLICYFSCIIPTVRGAVYEFKAHKNYAWESNYVRNKFLVCALLGVAVTSYFNPFLNNPMGITVLMVTAAATRGLAFAKTAAVKFVESEE